MAKESEKRRNVGKNGVAPELRNGDIAKFDSHGDCLYMVILINDE